MFHRCFDFYDDHAAVKLLFLYWHPDTGLILYMWWVFTLNLIFFFFFKSMYFICDECTCTCSWSLPLDTQRCSCCCRCPLSRGRCWALQLSNCLIFFYYSYLINLLRLLLERVERLLFSIYCCTYCNITVLLWRSTAHLKALNSSLRNVTCDFCSLYFSHRKKNQPGLAQSTFILFVFTKFHFTQSGWGFYALNLQCKALSMQYTVCILYSNPTVPKINQDVFISLD